jgi:hypothetical protein
MRSFILGFSPVSQSTRNRLAFSSFLSMAARRRERGADYQRACEHTGAMK